jgi:FdhD protein
MDLEDFTFGYLRDGLYIKSKDEVENIEVDKSVIKVTLSPEKTVVEGNIGCYDGWRDREQEITRVESDFKVDRKEIFDSFDDLIEKAQIWSQTGGTHVAALSSDNHFMVREDVSRHVAIDKVIGAGLIADLDFSKSYIICSGRIPPARVVKLANVGIPIMITRAAPTMEGIKMGEKANITLVGFLRDGRFNIYTHPKRIVL